MNITDNERELIAEFISANLSNIIKYSAVYIKKIDEKIKLHLKSTYTTYLTNTSKKYSKTKSFFIRSLSMHLYDYYTPINIKCKNIEIENPGIKSCTTHSNRMVITGSAGSGKSMFIRHLFLDTIKEKNFVPLLIELRDLNEGNISLIDAILKNLKRHGFDMSNEYIEMAKQEGHFCFFLDGYDEVDHENQKNVLSEIKLISDKYKKCPIIISSRSCYSIESIDDFCVFCMQKIDINSAIHLIKKLPYDEILKNKFIKNLQIGYFNKYQSFISNPLLLSIMLLTYGEKSDIPSKISLFYNYAYEALFQRHDAYKGGYSRCRRSKLDILDFTSVFKLFSLMTYDKRSFSMPKRDCLEHIEKCKKNLSFNFGTEEYLYDCLEAVCLLIEDGLDISFTHRSFQEYFVALYLSSCEEKIQKILLEKYVNYMHEDTVFTILFEISPRVLEKFILIPYLEEIFNTIGAKSEFTYENFINFINSFFGRITINGGVISLALNDNHDSRMLILLKLHLFYNKLDYTIRHDIDTVSDRCKYITGETEGFYYFDFEKNDYNFNTLDIMGEYIFLMRFNLWKSLYRQYKEMKYKHMNSIKSLEELLS